MQRTLTLLTPHMGSLLADQQDKQSGSYQQGKQNTGDERNNRMPTRLDLFRSRAFLRRSDAQPEEKFVHRQDPRGNYRFLSIRCDCNWDHFHRLPLSVGTFNGSGGLWPTGWGRTAFTSVFIR